jgi:flagellar biosynthetic protein FlhB
MSDDSNDDDKEFEASQHKLDEARKKGDFPRSVDLNTASAYAGLLVAGVSIGAASLMKIGSDLAGLLGNSDTLSQSVFSSSGAPMMGGMMLNLGVGLVPWFAIPALFVILSIMVQRGFVFAPTKLEPKLSRISPISQAKNKFGRSGLFEFAKSFVKLVIYSTVLFMFLAGRLPDIMGAMALSSGQVIATLLQLCLSLMFIVLVIAFCLGAIDYTWQRAEHLRKNRMSHKEIMDETKNAEGDQHLKQERRQRALSIAQNQMMGDVPKADVVVVNPTHYAVALKWSRRPGEAPVCIAKGVDDIALAIREVAKKADVPIHSDPTTARSLFATVRIGDQITPEFYQAVAAAIRFAEAMRMKAKARI